MIINKVQWNKDTGSCRCFHPVHSLVLVFCVQVMINNKHVSAGTPFEVKDGTRHLDI